uniref:Uncharacterized protein n=1 Tax=Brassica campestris TaxID=3711 RepID=M4CID8_BRACM
MAETSSGAMRLKPCSFGCRRFYRRQPQDAAFGRDVRRSFLRQRNEQELMQNVDAAAAAGTCGNQTNSPLVLPISSDFSQSNSNVFHHLIPVGGFSSGNPRLSLYGTGSGLLSVYGPFNGLGVKESGFQFCPPPNLILRTGTFLWIGLDLRRRSLFDFNTSASSMYSYSTDLRCRL